MTQVLIASDATERSDEVVSRGIAFAKQIDAVAIVLHVLTEQRAEDLRLSLGRGNAFADSVVELLTDSLVEQIERTGGGPASARWCCLAQ